MRRREFVTLAGGAAAWPLAARAQQRAIPVLGVLDPGAPEPTASLMAAFRRGLSEGGFVDGQNLAIEYRFAHNDAGQLSELTADLVRRRVTAIVSPNGAAAALAAKAATTTIPIVFGTGVDPVQIGLVPSLNRPGGNITGISTMATELNAKRLGLLHELVPSAERLAALMQPNEPQTERMTADLKVAAQSLRKPIDIIYTNSGEEIDVAYASLAQKRVGGLLISPSSNLLFQNRRTQLVVLSVRFAVPVIYPVRVYAEAGGLMSYGSSSSDTYRQVGLYTARVLKGEKPADLPIMRPTRFEFVINLHTAKTQGLTVPPTLLAQADEVIE